MHHALATLLSYSRVIARRGYPELARYIDSARHRGELVSVLPGVYAPTELAGRWEVCADAVALWDPLAVVVGDAAAALSFWPELVPSAVRVATSRRLPPRPGLTFTQRVVPSELVTSRAGIRYARPELTALDLVPRAGTDVIDRVLRSRMTDLRGLRRALDLSACRVGNPERLRALVDSCGEPWSALERLAHRHLYAAGITDWRANVEIAAGGFTFYQDIAMTRCPLTLELDGFETHGSRKSFEDDRRRGNFLLLAGRDVLHFTWAMVHDDPAYVVATVEAALRRY